MLNYIKTTKFKIFIDNMKFFGGETILFLRIKVILRKRGFKKDLKIFSENNNGFVNLNTKLRRS